MTGTRPLSRAQQFENRAFLRELQRTGNARETARAVGDHRAKFTKRRAKHPAFAQILCELFSMSRLIRIAVALVIVPVSPLVAQRTQQAYDFQERTRELAFDPARFFPGRAAPAMAIRYLGEDYGFPVHAIAVRRGCADSDRDEARKTCGERLTARMVRSPYNGNPPRA